MIGVSDVCREDMERRLGEWGSDLLPMRLVCDDTRLAAAHMWRLQFS